MAEAHERRASEWSSWYFVDFYHKNASENIMLERQRVFL